MVIQRLLYHGNTTTHNTMVIQRLLYRCKTMVNVYCCNTTTQNTMVIQRLPYHCKTMVTVYRCNTTTQNTMVVQRLGYFTTVKQRLMFTMVIQRSKAHGNKTVTLPLYSNGNCLPLQYNDQKHMVIQATQQLFY